MGTKQRILVAMSGGVDSAAAAALLAEQGHEVVGVTLKFWRYGEAVSRTRTCCSLQDVEDARGTAAALGIPHVVLDEERAFEKAVVTPFVESYLAGETPNPCVWCNARLKFGRLLETARKLGFDAVATGHYARVEETTDGPVLKKALDPDKDQSYMLWGLRRRDLPQVRFPLGDRSKRDTRDTVRRRGMTVAAKRESQDVCFVPRGRYGEFLQARRGDALQTTPGDIVDRAGVVLGRHRGAAYYTVGQRRGLGIAAAAPRYVIGLDAGRNRVVVGTEEDLLRGETRVRDVNWVSCPPPVRPFEARVKIRYRARAATATVIPDGDTTARVVFARPQRAVAPGQSAVFYRDDVLLGGGVIQPS